MNLLRTCLLVVVVPILLSCSRTHSVTPATTVGASSYRGMSVVDDNVAWISGSGGMFARTTDGGKTWMADSIDGYTEFGFRSIYAFDDKRALIGNAGSPAYILSTQDAGESWSVVYVNKDTSAFLDGVDFWDEENGLFYGDPIGGRVLLIRTTDGGRTWMDLPVADRPQLDDGEYSFAASGTGIRCYGESRLVMSTGGKVSRLWRSEDAGRTWEALKTPMIQGEAATGIFSFTYLNQEYVVIVGGDYTKEDQRIDHVFISRDGGSDWVPPLASTGGYRECVEVVEGNTLVATGPSGTDISYDGGEHWVSISDAKGYHVVRKARNGSLVLFAGNKGQVARLQ